MPKQKQMILKWYYIGTQIIVGAFMVFLAPYIVPSNSTEEIYQAGMFILGIAFLISAYGLYKEQKWGFALVVLTDLLLFIPNPFSIIVLALMLPGMMTGGLLTLLGANPYVTWVLGHFLLLGYLAYIKWFKKKKR